MSWVVYLIQIALHVWAHLLVYKDYDEATLLTASIAINAVLTTAVITIAVKLTMSDPTDPLVKLSKELVYKLTQRLKDEEGLRCQICES